MEKTEFGTKYWTGLIWLLNAFIIVASIVIVSCKGTSPLVEQEYPDVEGVEIEYPDINTSTEMIAGSGGYNYGKHLKNSMHTQFGINCMNNCHMTPTLEWEESKSDTFKLTSADGKENVDVCNKCHPPAVGMGLETFNSSRFNRAPIGNYDGDEGAEGVQDEVQGLLNLLLEAIQASGVTILDQDPFWENVTTDEQKHAIYNWLFVSNDKSLGVHNTARSVELLQFSYKDLTGQEVPGADLYSHVPIPETIQSSIVIEPILKVEDLTKDGKPIKSTALPNVGVGSYVILKGFSRTITKDNPAVSTEWSLIPPEGSTAVITEVDKEFVYFLADKMAMYSGLQSMAVSGDGSVFVASGNRIYALDSRGKLTTLGES